MINPNTIPLVSLESMNTTHLEEVKIINRLLKELQTKTDNKTLSQTLEQLLVHIQEHFSGEEKLMRDIQYPSLNMHKADHDKVLNQMRYAEMIWRNQKDTELLNEYIEEELAPWLDQHIKAMDTPMANFISQSNF